MNHHRLRPPAPRPEGGPNGYRVTTLAAALCALLAVAAAANAADFHLTPAGGGTRDGSTWENALDQSALSAVVNERMQPGDRLLVGGGTYAGAQLTVNKGGAAGRPKTIAGADRGQGLPVFTGTWSPDEPTKGTFGLRLAPGVSHVTFEGLRLRGHVMAVQAPDSPDAPRTHLTFNDVDAEQFRYGYYLSDCDDVQLTGCDLKRYTKHGFRLEAGCDRVAVRRCTADCSEGDAEWEKKTELFPFGFSLNDGGAPNTAVLFEDCLARNNMMPLQKKSYKNGDGFVVEGNAADVTFLRCRSIRNQDGGYDLKVRDVKLTDCVATGNGKGFRVWTTGTLTNCFAGWQPVGLWSNGGPLAVSRSTFHGCKAAVMTDDRSTGPVTLTNCIVSETPKTHVNTARGKVELRDTLVAEPGKPESDPRYVHADPAWDGLGGAMNSRAFQDKGFHADQAKGK